MPLDVATVLALASVCAPAVAPQTLLAVAQVESGLDPLAIGINPPGAPRRRASTLAEAVGQAEALIAARHNIDLGLGQINSRNLGWLGLTVPAAFDPCRNLAASARVLETGYRRAAHLPGQEQAALRTALSLYNTGHPERGLRNGYVAKVTAAANLLNPASKVPDLATAPQTPEHEPPAWDVFGRARRGAPSFVFTSSAGVQP